MINNLTIGIDKEQDPEGSFQRLAAVCKTLMDLDSDAILIVRSVAGIVLEANRECLGMLGYTKDEIIQRCLSDIMIDFPDITAMHAVNAGHDEMMLFMQETTWKNSAGASIPVKASMKKIEAPGEAVFIIIARDLRELQEKENALRSSNARYHDLVETSGEGLGMVDPDERFSFVNPAACEIFGLQQKELLGKSLLEFLDDSTIEEIKRQTALRQQGEKSIYEIEIHRLDDVRRWIIVTATPQFDAEQRFTGTLGIFRDITERKLAETRLRESEQRLHEIVDITNDWIWEINPAWKYSFVSPKVFSILGYQPEEMIGKSPFDFILPEDAEKVKEGVRGMVHQFKPLNAIVNRAKHKNGQIVYLETSGIAVFNEQGLYQGYRGADRDITLRKINERELIGAKEKAEESDRLKTSILSNMSHELRTPLTGILGFAEILKEELSQTEYESMVDNIADSGKRLMSTLNSIITLSQLEAGNINLTLKKVMVEQSIHSVVKSMESLCSEKNIYLDCTGIRPFSINTDAQLFKQLLLQIVDNAVKFTEKGGVSIETLKRTHSGREYVVVRIADTGIGIDKAYYTLIFQEFRQVSEGFGRKYQGSGIGLTISKKIIDLLGGIIMIESEPDKGSCFSIWMPCDPDIPGYNDSITDAAEPGLVDQDHFLMKPLPVVLLVEDNKVNKELIYFFLRNTCQMEYAPDAATALEMARDNDYNVILMDIHLGYGMNGIEAIREIRQIPRHLKTPVIAVTGYTMDEDREQLYAVGCNRHLAKPFDKKALLTMVQEVLHGQGTTS